MVPAVSVVLLAGCSQPPLLSLNGRACDRAPRLEPSNTVSLKSRGGTTITLDDASPCIETPAGRATYAVFALPTASSPYQLTVRSSPRGGALIAPEATIYGADERSRRDIGAFRAAAGSLVASVTGEPGDHYVVVRSTPGVIGDHRVIPTAANPPPPVRLAAAIIIIPAPPPAPIGPTTDTISTVLAHSGAITVSAAPFVTVP